MMMSLTLSIWRKAVYFSCGLLLLAVDSVVAQAFDSESTLPSSLWETQRARGAGASACPAPTEKLLFWEGPTQYSGLGNLLDGYFNAVGDCRLKGPRL